MLHGATEVEYKFEALAHFDDACRQTTTVLAADPFVKSLNVAVSSMLQQEQPVTRSGLRDAEAFQHVRVGTVP